jgi:YbbR domain-containing protein
MNNDKKAEKRFAARKKKAEKEKERREKDAERKVEIARRIAEQSKHMSASYRRFENAMMRCLRWFSILLDKIIFNRRHAVLISFVLAVLMCVSVNANSLRGLASSTLTSSRSVTDVTLHVEYNEDAYEVSGAPDTVDVTFTGDASAVTNAASSSEGELLIDLTGLGEGTHNVKVTAEGYDDNVNVKTDPSTVTVTLNRKITREFTISYDFINQDDMDSVYTLGTPTFEDTTVNVRASEDTLNSIASVKALIDVTVVTADFEQDAKLIAYDSDGQVVDAEIVPKTMHVSVPVSSNSKTVPIEIVVSGEVSGSQAIASLTSDQTSVTIYGSEENLAQVDYVTVSLDASTITKDGDILRPITLPDGISSASINQVTLTVKLGDKTTKEVDGVKINYINNTAGYTATQEDNITTTTVIVSGTAANIAGVTADDIYVYIDMEDAQPGTQTFELQVEQPTDGLVRYELEDDTYELTINGTSTATPTSEGEENNG